MSQQNVEVVRKFVDGLVAGEPTALAPLHPDIEWHVEDTLPDPQVFHGHAGVQQFFAELREVWSELRFEATEYASEDDWVFLELTQVSYGSGSAVPVEQHLYPVFRLRDGRVVRFDVYFDRQRGREAVGLAG